MVLGFAEMLEEDRPDDAIWLNEDLLVEHFEDLKIKRKAKLEQSGTKDDEGWSSVEEQESNQLADDLLREVGVG